MVREIPWQWRYPLYIHMYVHIYTHTYRSIYIYVCILAKNISGRAICTVWFHFLKSKTVIYLQVILNIFKLINVCMNLKMVHMRSSRHLLMFTSEEWDGVWEWQFLFLFLPSILFYSLLNFLIKNTKELHIIYKKQIRLGISSYESKRQVV